MNKKVLHWPKSVILVINLINLGIFIFGVLIDIPNLSILPIFIWITIGLFLLAATFNSLLPFIEKPLLIIQNYGIESKTFRDIKQRSGLFKKAKYEYPIRLCPFLDINSEIISAEKVYPIVEWSKSDVKIPINQGRWWIANEDLQHNKIDQQTVDLEPNGMTRRLYIGITDPPGCNKGFYAWYRTQDGHDHYHHLSSDKDQWQVKVSFRSRNNGMVIGRYILQYSPIELDFREIKKRG